ncbi:MAG: CoA transferase [Dehalococcoidia bacterium]|nr:CoA transferase [Dehalococcoidia bacterium]
MGKLPLEGIRVADFTWGLSGPYSMEWLSVMGAEIILIESTLRPSSTRSNAFVQTGVEAGLNQAAGYNCLNYGKRGCTINLQTKNGVELAKRIIKVSDVVSDSFAYGVMERHGLGYEELKKLKSDIIVFSKSAMGAYGRERHLFGWGTAVISYAGLASTTGYEDDGMPQMMGGTWPDYTIGTYSPFTILSALYHKKKTGKGMFVDYSMCEGVMTMMPEAMMDYTMNGRVAVPQGNRDPRMAPHNIYRCQGDDKWVAIAVENEEQWNALCRVTGNDEWAEEERFADLYGRQRNLEELDKLIDAWTRERTAPEVAELLQGVGVPAGPTNNANDLVMDQHLKARGQFVEITHPEMGTRWAPALPAGLSAVPNPRYESSPLIGQYNEYVFGELLGLNSSEIGQLIEERVIV